MSEVISLGLSVSGSVAVMIVINRDEHGIYSVLACERLPFNRDDDDHTHLQAVLYHNAKSLCEKYRVENLGVMFRRSPNMRIERMRGILELIPFNVKSYIPDDFSITEYTRREVQQVISGEEESERYSNLQMIEDMFDDKSDIEVHLNINLNSLMCAIAVIKELNNEVEYEKSET